MPQRSVPWSLEAGLAYVSKRPERGTLEQINGRKKQNDSLPLTYDDRDRAGWGSESAGRGSICAKPKSTSGWRPNACSWLGSYAMPRAELCCLKWRRAGSTLPSMCEQKMEPDKVPMGLSRL